jgi:hypothetical protein
MKHTCNLYFNAAKQRADQPDLTGKLDIDKTRWRLALWQQETKDGTRDYFSGSMSEDGSKSNPRFKLKLYQFAKNKPDDPDYHDQSFALDDVPWVAYLWIQQRKGTHDIDVVFELSDEAREQKPSELAQEFKQRMAERFSKKPETVGVDADGTPDDLPF